MRRVLSLPLFVLLALPAAAQVAGPPPNCCVEDTLAMANCQCGRCECCRAIRPPLYVRAEGLFLTRDVDGAAPVATEGPNPQNIVLSTTQFDQPFRGGPKLVIGHTFGDSPFGIEFSFFSVSEWQEGFSVRNNAENDLGSAGNLFSPFTNFGDPAFGGPTTLGFDYNDFVAVREISDLDSEEINIRHLLPMPTRCLTVSWLVGVRHIGIHEQFDYHSESAVPGPAGSFIDLRTNTGNRMWGPQIGGLFEFYAQHCCWVNFEIKGALLGNSAYQETTGSHPDQLFWGRRDASLTAFSADFDLTLVYHPTRWLTARVGYQALWVGGLALASENFSAPADKLLFGPPVLRDDGEVLYHGPHMGLELHW